MKTSNPPAGFFVTGTDTEVGKTLVSGALILKLKQLGRNVAGFKPVVAGTYQDKDQHLVNEDLETLRLAADTRLSGQALCPYILNTPAAPHLVAKAAGIDLDIKVIEAAYQAVATQCDAVVAEGAGGFLVPLNDQTDLSEVAQLIGLPVILVVGMRLGCINHALLTYEAIKMRRLPIAGWVANALKEEMSLLQENLLTLRKRIDAPYLGLIPSLPNDLQKPVNAPYSMEALQFAAQHISLP